MLMFPGTPVRVGMTARTEHKLKCLIEFLKQNESYIVFKVKLNVSICMGHVNLP